MSYDNHKRHLAERRGDHIDAASAINETAEREKRDLLPSESRAFDNHMRQAEILAAEIAACEPLNPEMDGLLARLGGGSQPTAPSTEWMNARGEPVYACTPGQKLADLPSNSNIDADLQGQRLSLGNAIRAVATGDWQRFAPRELKALGENTNSGGGFLVPSELSNVFIDLARSQSVLIRAGATTIPMESDAMTLAKLTSDPTFELKVENAAFSFSDPVFGAVNLHAATIGQVCTISRELAADGPNAAQIVEQTLARGLAAKIDLMALAGTGSAEWDGLLYNANIGATGSVGAIAWEDLQTAVVDVQSNNHEPTSWIASPTIAGDLAALTSGDGVNSAKMWLGPPPNVEPLQRFVTTNCPDTSLFVGDFSKFVFGVRQEAMIEVTTEAGDAFAKHQVLVKIVFRGAIAVTQPEAFHRLDGITT